MFDWIPWAVSVMLLAAIAFLATIAFRGGQARGQHINWEQAEAAHGATRAASRREAMEALYRVIYAALAFGVLVAAAAMLIGWAVTHE